MTPNELPVASQENEAQAASVTTVVITAPDALPTHSVTANELRQILDDRDQRIIATIRDELYREIDTRMVAFATALDARPTMQQVNERIDSSAQAVVRKFEAFQEDMSTFMRKLERSMDRQEAFARAQGEINARVNGVLEAMTGQRDAQIDALAKDGARRDIEIAETNKSIETLRLAHLQTAGRAALLWQDVRGAEGDGQPSLFQMIRDMEARTNARLDKLADAMTAITETVTEDHKFIDRLRKLLSWKSLMDGAKFASKTVTGLPLAIRLAGLLTAGALATQAVAPDVIPETVKAIEALLK